MNLVFTSDGIEHGLTSPNLEIRKSFAEDTDVFGSLTDYQIVRGLNDKSPVIRYIFTKMCFDSEVSFTQQQLEAGINDENSSVRALFIRNSDTISSEQIKFYLQYSSIETKLAIIASHNFPVAFTHEHINLIFSSNDKRVITNFIKYFGLRSSYGGVKTLFNTLWNNYSSNLYLSDPCLRKELALCFAKFIPRYELERGLIDQCASVRRTFGDELLCYNFSRDTRVSYIQLERGLTDIDSSVKESFSNRNYLFYTEKQIARALNDDNITVRRSFVANNQVTLTNSQITDIFRNDIYEVTYALIGRDRLTVKNRHIKLGLASKHCDIRKFFANECISLTGDQIKYGLNDSDVDVAASFVCRSDSSNFLNKEKIEQALLNHSLLIRYKMAKKNDIVLSSDQIDRGLKDEHESIRVEFAKRKDFAPNREQIDRAIRDTSSRVILAFLLDRDDVTLTKEQTSYLFSSKHIDALSGAGIIYGSPLYLEKCNV